MFINYTPQTGVTVSSSRLTGAYYGEISDVVEACWNFDRAPVCCDLDITRSILECRGDWERKYPAEILEVIRARIQAFDNPDPGNPVLRPRAAPDA